MVVQIKYLYKHNNMQYDTPFGKDTTMEKKPSFYTMTRFMACK